MAGVTPSFPFFTFTDVSGVPLSKGIVNVYLTGSTTNTNTWHDSAQTTLNDNPLHLDRFGQAIMFLDPSITYRFLVNDSKGNFQYVLDGITGSNDKRFYAPTYASNPTTRPDGTPIQAGDRYNNTTDNNEYIYIGGAWVSQATQAAAAASGYASAASTSATSAAGSASAALGYSNAATLAAAASGVYPNAAASNVPRGLTQASVGAITAGSGGTNGTFALAWSSGNFSVNPTGTFTVAGNVVTAVTITGPGLYIGSSPTVPTPSFAASAGLTGAAVALTAQFLVTSGQGYWVESSDGSLLNRYKNVSGVATADAGVSPIPNWTFSATVPLSRTVQALQDVNGDFIAGTRSSGLRVRWDNPNGRRVYSRLMGGFQQVFIADKLGESQLTFSGNNTNPEITANYILFTSDRRGTPEPYFMGFNGESPTPAATLVTEHFQVCGQSRASADVCNLALSTSNVDSRASMLSLSVAPPYGPRTMLDSNPVADDSGIDITKVTGLTPLVEAAKNSRGETISSGFAAQYLRGQASTERIVLDVHARGAAPYANPQPGTGNITWLAPGSLHFMNAILFQELVRKYVEAGGGAYRYAGTLNVHGEADAFAGTSRATYLADVQAWIAAYNSQARHGSALHRAQRMFLAQMANMNYASSGVQNCLNIALAQMDAHQLHAGLFLIGPSYMFPMADDTHLTAAGNRWHGEYFGKAARRVIKEGVAWEPVYPKSWTRSGAVLNVKFNVPVAPLVFDTSVVSDPGHGGFTYTDDTASGITVTAVAIGSDGVSVNVTLSGTGFGTNPRFRIAGSQTGANAGPTLGARSTLHDSDSEVGVLSGNTLYNYACTFEGAIA